MLLLVQLFIHLHQLQFNNQLLLLVAHILGGSVRTKIGSGHSRPGENSWKVTSTKLLADWRVPRGFWQRWSDLVAQTSRSKDKTALLGPSYNLLCDLGSGIWKALLLLWQTITSKTRIEKPLTRGTVGLYILNFVSS